jgi:hypothetical protein
LQGMPQSRIGRARSYVADRLSKEATGFPIGMFLFCPSQRPQRLAHKLLFVGEHELFEPLNY